MHGKKWNENEEKMKFPNPRWKILNINFSFMAFIATATAIMPEIFRNILFEDTKTGQQLTGSVIKTLPTVSKIFCSLKCAHLPRCQSFNYCEPSICLLNSEDFYSAANSDKLVVRYPNCEYRGMKRDYVPNCYERGILKPITDDDNPGNCNINQKRIDALYGPWTRHINQTDTEWKVFDVREALIQSGDHACVYGNTCWIQSWFKIGSDDKNWMDSKLFCEEIGGELFSDVDGTTEQLDFFFEVFGERKYWLGIYRTDLRSWRNIKGNEVPNEYLKWDVDYPTNQSNHKYVLIYYKNSRSRPEYLKNKNQGLKALPLCDLRKIWLQKKLKEQFRSHCLLRHTCVDFLRIIQKKLTLQIF